MPPLIVQVVFPVSGHKLRARMRFFIFSLALLLEPEHVCVVEMNAVGGFVVTPMADINCESVALALFSAGAAEYVMLFQR